MSVSFVPAGLLLKAMDNETQCPVCECRNPCDVAKFPEGEECQMVVSLCPEAPFCPALPFCTAVQRNREDEIILKAGQCPYLVPVSVDSCDSECSADEDCDGQQKYAVPTVAEPNASSR